MTIDELKKRIIPVLKQYGIKKAGLFGSTAKGETRGDSDIDILVDFGDKRLSLFDFVGIKLKLEDVLGKKVDLVEYSTIKPLIKNIILAEEVGLL